MVVLDKEPVNFALLHRLLFCANIIIYADTPVGICKQKHSPKSFELHFNIMDVY